MRELAPVLGRDEWRRAQAEIELAKKHSISVIHLFDPGYPPELYAIADPPLVIFVRGALPAAPRVGIVGTRRCTGYGRQIASFFSREHTRRGGCIVSGLAFGIDAAAHRGAVEGAPAAAGGSGSAGIAVLGSGVMNPAPAANCALAAEVLQARGALISEYGVSTQSRAYFFPRRNRIISALSNAVVIVEAAEKSGSLITARLALEQGREVCAVPGPVDSLTSAGPNKLIKEGATVVMRPDDLGRFLPEDRRELQQKQCAGKSRQRREGNLASLGMDDDQARLAGAMLKLIRTKRVCDIDGFVSSLSCPAAEIFAVAAQLEIAGFVVSEGGGCYRIAEIIDT